jgi:hypothetical protein
VDASCWYRDGTCWLVGWLAVKDDDGDDGLTYWQISGVLSDLGMYGVYD